MEGSKLKTELSTSDFEMETQQLDFQAKTRVFRMIDTSRVVLTGLALAAGLAALGLSADALLIYNNTHVSPEFMLPLWPESFDLRPTHALIAGSTIIIVANGIGILTSRLQALRQRRGISTSVNLAAPAVSFVAALVAMCLFYAVNASTTADTIQSWTCRWRSVAMMSQPYFGTLCKQSEAGVALSVLLVPLEAVLLAVAAYQQRLQKQLDAMTIESRAQKQSSPALS